MEKKPAIDGFDPMAKLSTITIATANGPVVINQTDFDPAIHEMHVPDATETPPQAPQAPVVGDPAPAGNEAPDEAPDVSPDPARKLFVAKDGKRFKVVNESGTVDGDFQKTGYANEAAAWDAIKAVT